METVQGNISICWACLMPLGLSGSSLNHTWCWSLSKAVGHDGGGRACSADEGEWQFLLESLYFQIINKKSGISRGFLFIPCEFKWFFIFGM